MNTFLRMLSDDTLDVVWAFLSKCHLEAFGAFFTLGGETVWVFAVNFWGLLAVADEVDYWMSLLGTSVLLLQFKEMR